MGGIWELMSPKFRQVWHPTVNMSTLPKVPCLPLGPLLHKLGIERIAFFIPGCRRQRAVYLAQHRLGPHHLWRGCRGSGRQQPGKGRRRARPYGGQRFSASRSASPHRLVFGPRLCGVVQGRGRGRVDDLPREFAGSTQVCSEFDVTLWCPKKGREGGEMIIERA